MFGFGENHEAVYGDKVHKSSLTHELIAGAAAFEAMKHHEANTDDKHKLTKELFAAFAAAEVDKLVETKGLDLVDRERTKHQAKVNAEKIYDEQYQ
ncbi:hypothetical protein EDD21DRAFT_371245 [Dissophora ornata]|nr:hypothetical protein BGZ58_005144 [Dissophora ornata]KAI8602636.1 hypothetical protein EDD21DRAFT_371245 [Dissophora ornata]